MAKRGSGHSLLSLLVGLSLTATVTALATPTFMEMRSATVSRDNLRGLQSLITLARSAAINRQTPVTVCMVDAAWRCRRHGRGAIAVVAFIDSNLNRRPDGDEVPLQQRFLGEGELRWRASLGRRYLQFRATGRTRQNGSLYYCPPNGDPRHAWTLVVNRVGRLYTTNDGDGDGIREDNRGQNLGCPL